MSDFSRPESLILHRGHLKKELNKFLESLITCDKFDKFKFKLFDEMIKKAFKMKKWNNYEDLLPFKVSSEVNDTVKANKKQQKVHSKNHDGE
jgi:hypothetical protein